ncbi:noggin-2-like [Gouania willdenowi]|uniref:Noggin-2-like n=1 Tax=Gouania willdenowi TaxID=441366 RepID=A0A8C5DMK7_GOUWI|nr:noggin-2-like [Gouania willdenowi]
MNNIMCGHLLCLSMALCLSLAFTVDISTTNPALNGSVVEEQDDTGWGSSFHQLRLSLPSYLQPIRPYTLQTHPQDFVHKPKSRHLRPARLLRLLGSSFDPFWMSVDETSEASEGQRPLLPGQPLNNNLSFPSALRDAAANIQVELENEAAELDFGSVPLPIAQMIRTRLVQSATCVLQQQWVDLGPTFWPRWLRQTDCKRSDGEQRCSFPTGMECVRDQTIDIRILAWHCGDVRDGDKRSRKRKKTKRFDSSSKAKGEDTKKRCLWRLVPYPVVTACRCSCV